MEEEKKEHWSKRGIKGDKNIRLKGGRSSMKRGSMCCCYERDRESVRERKRFEKEKLSNLIFFFLNERRVYLERKGKNML